MASVGVFKEPPPPTSAAARSSACATLWPPPSHFFATYTDLRPCLAHVAVAKASLLHLEDQLDDGDAEQSLKRILAATAELQLAFEFIDALELGVASAGDLVEATERRLNTLELGEPLPDSLAQLPPPTFSASQFSRQLRRREKAATLDLPELVLLPPSDSAGGGQRPRTSVEGLATAAEQVATVAAAAAAVAAAAAAAAPKSVDEARVRAEQVASAAASAAAAAAAAAPKSVDEAKALASAFLGRAVAKTPSSLADGINGAWTAFRRFQEKE
jgi:hypothetical protein